MSRQKGFAIIGYGMAASMHARALENVDQAKLLAVTGRNIEKARKFADKYNIKVLKLSEVLKSREMDVVDICTPSGTHLKYARKAAKANKHILVEKPLESSLGRTNQLINICEQNEVVLGSVFQHRYDKASMKLKAYQDKGLLGKPVLGSAYIKWYRDQDYYEESPWRKDADMAGSGALGTQASHTIDLLLWYLGYPQTVYSITETITHDIEVEDLSLASIKFENGALGTIEASTSIYPGFPERLELHFENGSAIIEGGELVYLKIDSNEVPVIDGKNAGASGASDPAAINIQPFSRMIEDYVEAIRGKKALMLDGKEGKRAVELIETIKEASAKNKVIDLNSGK